MKGLLPVFKRELSGYFTTPVALVFIVIFLFLAGSSPSTSARTSSAARPTWSSFSTSIPGCICS